MSHLYLVQLVNSRTGAVLAGGHYLAATGFEARTIGRADILRCARDGFTMGPDDGFISRRSSASLSNAINVKA